jgi:hypothetical protein
MGFVILAYNTPGHYMAAKHAAGAFYPTLAQPVALVKMLIATFNVGLSF